MGVDPAARTRVSESVPDPFVGRVVAGYRVESLLGRGGMGTVYRALQISLGRAVALKILPEDLAASAQFLDRFEREAEILSKLSHPNIVTVFDRGTVDGRPYLVMEYVEGTTLREVLRKGPLPAGDALRIVSSVLAALDHAHRHGIIHRDVKPENVLLSHGTLVKVADFGLSRLVGPQEQTRLTRTHLLLGTFEYMAPEQRERARDADSRSDLYATGVVLYEMLTGELPIGRFDLPSQRRPGECDRRIDGIVERSLEKDPERRYQRAGEMADAVSAVLEKPAAKSKGGAGGRGITDRATGLAGSFRPVRFEVHLDNVATVDSVLGMLSYVFGFCMLFGVSIFGGRIAWGLPFFLFFILGWYLQETAKGLRSYASSARTSQALIAVVAGLTVILLPFAAYALWVLFGHRGRTYYDARGRGLNEAEAARHTYRMMEEPFAPAAPQPPPARPPTPSQIPLQSVVTSEVRPRRRERRIWGKLILTILVLGFAGSLLLRGTRGGSSPEPPAQVHSGPRRVVARVVNPSHYRGMNVDATFTPAHMRWLLEIVGLEASASEAIRFRVAGDLISADLPEAWSFDRRTSLRIAAAIGAALERATGGAVQRHHGATADPEFERLLAEKPPP
ncbi:MAG: serine/threonine-protein kinase [Planctomycetaceae bacterium]